MNLLLIRIAWILLIMVGIVFICKDTKPPKNRGGGCAYKY